MTLVELKQILESTGYPVAYSHFNSPQKPPFIVYLVDDTSNFFADNHVFKKIDNVQVELYTNKKDLQAEQRLEQLFFDNEIPWDSTEIFIQSEKLFQKIYEVRLL
jgi:hypothetical protein